MNAYEDPLFWAMVQDQVIEVDWDDVKTYVENNGIPNWWPLTLQDWCDSVR